MFQHWFNYDLIAMQMFFDEDVAKIVQFGVTVLCTATEHGKQIPNVLFEIVSWPHILSHAIDLLFIKSCILLFAVYHIY